MIQISIITVGMNHLSYLKPLLASIYGENQPKTPFEMIYVDNCSTDVSVEYIKAIYPQVKIIANIEPLGFGENNNKGVFASTENLWGLAKTITKGCSLLQANTSQ